MGNASSHSSAAGVFRFCKARASFCKAFEELDQEVPQPSDRNHPELERVEPDDHDLGDLPELEAVPECGICSDVVEQGLLHLSCGHTFCAECIQSQLRARWPGSRMSFGYLNCALCRVPIMHRQIQVQVAVHLELQERAVKAAVQKFRDDGLVEEMQQTFSTPVSDSEISLRAVKEMAVFQCCDCKEPYCAGRMDCAAVQNHEGEETRCPDCEWAAVKDSNDHRCMIHGHRFAMFKCDSCCNIAVWNCTSHHYCERCHNQAGDKKHYPCPGPELCPLGMAHPPNQEAVHCSEQCASFCIGCTACLGCTEAENPPVNDTIALSFQEKWLKFENGAHVLAVLGEAEVRAQLQILQPGRNDEFGAEACADAVLALAVEAYLKAAAEVKRQAEEMRFQREHAEEYYQRGLERGREEEERERKEHALWAEVDKERLAPSITPDWQLLREERRAKQLCRSNARQAQLEHKQKRLQKHQRSCSNSSQKKRSDRSRCKGTHIRVLMEMSESTSEVGAF